MSLDDSNKQPNLKQEIFGALPIKTLTAPYSRLQVILQNQTYLAQIGLYPERLQNINSTQVSLGSLASYLYKNEGFLSLWRGHSMAVLRCIGETLLNHFIKPSINSVFGITSNKPNDSNNNSNNSNKTDQSKMERSRSVDDPELANTEVPAFIDMIIQHQPKSKVNNSGDNKGNLTRVYSDRHVDTAQQSVSVNNNRNVSFSKILKYHATHEIYPILSLLILYPLNVFHTYYQLDLKHVQNNDTGSNNGDSGEVDYAFNKGYYKCYQQLGGTFDILYSGAISACIGTLVYRQTFFNMRRVIDWLLYKITGNVPPSNTNPHGSPAIKVTSHDDDDEDDDEDEEENKEEQMFQFLNQTLRSVIVTNIAMFMQFPFQVIKYRMILNRHPNSNTKYSGYKDCVVTTYRNEGYKAFFVGATANLVLGFVASIILVTVDVAKSRLKQLEEQQRNNRQRNLPRAMRIGKIRA